MAGSRAASDEPGTLLVTEAEATERDGLVPAAAPLRLGCSVQRVALVAAAVVAVTLASLVALPRRPAERAASVAQELLVEAQLQKKLQKLLQVEAQKLLVEAHPEEQCTPGRDNCNVTKCCATPGFQCYEQNALFAQCRQGCRSGPDPSHWDGQAWSCKELGARSPGTFSCSTAKENCAETQCCTDAGVQCHQKNESFATCKVSCIAGAPDLYDADAGHWSCKALGEPAPGAGAWVAKQCAADGQDCRSKQCCATPGQQCYKQSDYWGQCMPAGQCTDPGWSCEALGSVTPSAAAPHDQGGKLPQWALEQCSALNGGCTDSRCCLGMEVQCYEKDKDWAQCLQGCTPGRHAEDNNETWSCNALGPRSMGLAIKGSPSLYCFSVFRKDGYEPGLLAVQLEKFAGIFGCDDYSLLTADGTTQVGGLTTTTFQGAPIVTSIDNTAGNTELFVNAWNVVVGLGKWRNHSFTIKVDPDAVFVPERARWHLAAHVGERMFVVNCRVGDMMFGALEVFSYSAIALWALRGHDQCGAPANYGEDKYMTTCMDSLGVARVRDEPIMGDKLCGTFTDCSHSWNAAFHPFKDPGQWMQCYDEAMTSLQNAR